MPCIFCIAVLTLIAGALASEQLDEIESRLEKTAKDRKVRRSVDTGSVAKFELTVRVASKDVPVSVTVYKDHKRVRLQILTHDLTPEQIAELEDDLARALGADIVDRVDGSREEEDEHEHDEVDEAGAEEAEKGRTERTERTSQAERAEPVRRSET